MKIKSIIKGTNTRYSQKILFYFECRSTKAIIRSDPRNFTPQTVKSIRAFHTYIPCTFLKIAYIFHMIFWTKNMQVTVAAEHDQLCFSASVLGDTISNMSIARDFPEKMSSIKILKFFPPAIEDIRGFVVKQETVYIVRPKTSLKGQPWRFKIPIEEIGLKLLHSQC